MVASMVIFTMEKCMGKCTKKSGTINDEKVVEDKIVNFLIELKDESISSKVYQKMIQRIANYD